jgi:DNA primase
MSVVDDVKQKIDIVEVIGQYASLKKAGRNLSALCPFHSEKTPSFLVYPEQQSWHCFGACNTGGDVFSFLMKKENTDFGEALRILADRAGVTIPSRFEQDTRRDEKERLYQVNEAAAQYFHNLLLNNPTAKKAREYLAGRNISQKTISDFRLGFSLKSWEALKNYLLEKDYSEDEILEAGLLVAAEDGKTHDRFRERLLFPINDNRGRTTGFGARVLDESFPKYVNSPQTPLFDKSGTLYGIDLAASSIRQQSMAVIVEGYMDVITAHQNGANNVVASMGTAITEKQVTTLKRSSRNLVLALDADAAGGEAMLRCVDYENILEAEIKVIVLPEGKDPDDVIKGDIELWQKLVAEAGPIVDYTFDVVGSKLDLTTAAGQTLLVSTLGPIILRIEDPIRRAHYLQKLARLTDKDVRTIEMALGGIKTTPRVRRLQAKTTERAVKPLAQSRTEQDCLALLLQHPQLKSREVGLVPEYFENTQNREIFANWQRTDDPVALREELDFALCEYFDSLISRKILATRIEERYNEYVLRLREDHFRNLERKRAASLAMEAEAGGSAAGLAKLEEQGINSSLGLLEVFTQKARKGREQRR